jgi:hypothetical protein
VRLDGGPSVRTVSYRPEYVHAGEQVLGTSSLQGLYGEERGDDHQSQHRDSRPRRLLAGSGQGLEHAGPSHQPTRPTLWSTAYITAIKLRWFSERSGTVPFTLGLGERETAKVGRESSFFMLNITTADTGWTVFSSWDDPLLPFTAPVLPSCSSDVVQIKVPIFRRLSRAH